MEVGHQLLSSSRRCGRPVAAAMIDLDHFKDINDTYGHGTGDDVIREVARRLTGALRGSDIICRYGGEEFAALLPETTLEQAMTVAQRLHDVITVAGVPTRTGPLHVTVSVGVAGSAPGEYDMPAVLAAADQALYAAKRGGRDRISTHRQADRR